MKKNKGMQFFKTFYRTVLFSALVLGMETAFAQGPQGKITPPDLEALRIDGIDDRVLQNDGVSFVYDASEFKDTVATEVPIEELKKLSEQMATEQYKAELEKKILVPLSIENSEDLAALQKLQAGEVSTFLARKTAFLEKMAKFFKALHLKVSAINKIVHSMNKQFFRNAGVIANANARVLTVQLSLSGGIGFSDWLMERLRKSPYFADLPARTGFYFMLSTGISIVKTQVDGKSRFSIEPVIDIRRSTKILLPFVYGSAGVVGSWTLENRQATPSLQQANFYKISSVSVLSGLQQFGFSTSAAMTFPPGGGLVSGVEGVVYRLRITPKVFPELLSLIRKSFLASAGLRCERVFQ